MFLFLVCFFFYCCRWWCASRDVWMLSLWLLKFISGTKNFAVDVWVGFTITTRSSGGGKVFYIWTEIFFFAIFLYSLWQRWGWIDGCDKAGGGVSVGSWHIDRLLLMLDQYSSYTTNTSITNNICSNGYTSNTGNTSNTCHMTPPSVITLSDSRQLLLVHWH